MDEEKQLHHRSHILLGLFALCLLFFCGILYNAQVVNAEEYLARSTTQVTTTRKVEASRGILTDRNGKVLVSNRQTYTVTFDPRQVPDEAGVSHDLTVSRAVLRLVQLCLRQGVQWTDTLPISRQAPFTYTFSESSAAQCTRLSKYLNKRKWSASELTVESAYPIPTDGALAKLGAASDILDARNLLELMREDMGIDSSFTPEELRLVAGVLYELELRALEINNLPYVFLEDVSVELISMLKDGNFVGTVISDESTRQYNTDSAAHVLGRVGYLSDDERAEMNLPYTEAKAQAEADGVEFDSSAWFYYRRDDLAGISGAERAFETYLRGKDGTRLITTNEDGKITSELYSIEPVPGATVALTIDIDFQEQVEQALANAIEAMNAADGSETRGGAAAVVNVADSGVLALATYPTYRQRTYSADYNTLLADPGKPFINRALNGAYAPGSTFKMVTSVAALESGIITPTTQIMDRGRYTYWSDYQPACWIYRQSGATHGLINVSEAIFHSCNYFFYDIGRQMGIDTLNTYATAFGLGQPTGIELGERTGILDGPEYRSEAGSMWFSGTLLACSIGQGDSLFTPLQLANYVATLVRGGVRYEAHILESVASYDSSQILYTHRPTTASTLDISPSTLSAVKKGMGDLVTKGSISQYFKNCVVSAGAKTGSAQTNQTVANGVFVCFAPFDAPEIAVAIVIEQGGSGAALAATAVEILNAYFSPSDIGTALIPEGTLLP